jgi:hypothetical protein
VQASFVQSKKACSSVAFYDTMELLLQVRADAIGLCVCAMATQARRGVKCGREGHKGVITALLAAGADESVTDAYGYE